MGVTKTPLLASETPDYETKDPKTTKFFKKGKGRKDGAAAAGRAAPRSRHSATPRPPHPFQDMFKTRFEPKRVHYSGVLSTKNSQKYSKGPTKSVLFRPKNLLPSEGGFPENRSALDSVFSPPWKARRRKEERRRPAAPRDLAVSAIKNRGQCDTFSFHFISFIHFISE